YHPAEESHAGQIGSAGLSCLSIVPQGALSRVGAHVRPRAHAELPGLAARCYRAFRDDDDASALGLETCALELMAALLRSSTSARPTCAPAWIGAVREHLSRHFARNVSL